MNTNERKIVGREHRRFRAFISYRHADNTEEGRRWAQWLHNELERYQVPRDLIGRPNAHGQPIPENLFPIFRDEEEMRAGEDLGALISDGLERSDWLIVLCSPRSAASRYVRREIMRFKLLGKTGRIMPVIIEGDPAGPRATQCFPRPLRRGVPVPGKKDYAGRDLIDWRARPELLAADLRPLGKAAQGYTSAAAFRAAMEARSSQSPETQKFTTRQLRDAERQYAAQLELQRLKIIAGLLGVDLGELTKRDAAARARRFKRLLLTSLATLAAIAIFAAIAVYQGLAARQSLAASRYSLANIASEEHGNPAEALLLASAALDTAPPTDPLKKVYARRAEMLALAAPRLIKLSDEVRTAVFSQAFDRVAVVDSQGRVRIGNLHTSEPIHVPSLTESTRTVGPFTLPSFSPDSARFVAGVDETTARTWRLSDGQSRASTTPFVVVRGTLQSQFYFSPDGRSTMGWVGVETGDEDGAHVEAAWDTQTGSATDVTALTALFKYGELAASLDPSRNWVVHPIDGGKLEIVDASTGRPVFAPFGPDAARVRSLALSPNAEWLATVSESTVNDGTEVAQELQIWSVRDGKVIDSKPLGSGRATIQDVSPDGRRVLLLTEIADSSVLELWELGRYLYRPSQALHTFSADDRSWARALSSRLAAFCNDGELVAAVSADTTAHGPEAQNRFTIRFWNAATFAELSHSLRSSGGLVTWRISRDGEEFGTVTADGVVTVTRLRWQESGAVHPADSARSIDLEATRAWFSRDGKSLTTASTTGITYIGGMPTSDGSPSVSLQRWRLPDLVPLWEKPVVQTSESADTIAAPTFAASRDGMRVAFAAANVNVLDALSGAPLRAPITVEGRVAGVAFNGDEIVVVASERYGTSKVEQWHTVGEQARPFTSITWRSSQGLFAGFAGDGRHFLRLSGASFSTRLDWSTVRNIELVDLSDTALLSLHITRQSPAPAILVATVLREATEVQRTAQGEAIATLPRARIRIRTVPTGAELMQMDAGRRLIAPAGVIDAAAPIAISEDALWIASVSAGRELRVWSAFDGAPSSEPILLTSESVAVAFDNPARHLMYAESSGRVHALYIGGESPDLTSWVGHAAEALTGMRLTSGGSEWLSAEQRRVARENLLKHLPKEGRGAAPVADIRSRFSSQ